MSVAFIDIGLFVFMALAGSAAGWWLRGSTIRRDSRRNDHESRRNRETLARLYDLAARVAADVGQHSNRVEEINEELASVKSPESDAVVTAVTRLIQTNEQMQQQLAHAQQRLREQARQMESSAAEARTDALTGLANRRAFDQETERCHDEFQRLGKDASLILIDVDHFKRFNDTYGHQAGDCVLHGLGQVYVQAARSTDLVARYGGEEFAFVLPATTVADANKLAEKVRKAVETRGFSHAGAELKVTISVGVAQFRKGEDVATLIQRADSALYAAKKAGRNRTYFHDGQESRAAVAQESPSAETTSPAAENPPAKSNTQPNLSEAAAKPRPENRPRPIQPLPLAPDPLPPASEPGADCESSVCNRTAFCMVLNRRLAELRRGGETLSVLLLHVDGYDRLKSQFGPQAAELAMRVTMQFLGASFREMDLVGQFQEATFAALLPGAKIDNAAAVAERLRQAIARCKFPVGNDRFQFTVSLAGAEASRDDDTERLLERTYTALEEVVKAGGNRTCVHQGQWTEMVEPTVESAPAR